MSLFTTGVVQFGVPIWNVYDYCYLIDVINKLLKFSYDSIKSKPIAIH